MATDALAIKTWPAAGGWKAGRNDRAPGKLIVPDASGVGSPDEACIRVELGRAPGPEAPTTAGALMFPGDGASALLPTSVALRACAAPARGLWYGGVCPSGGPGPDVFPENDDMVSSHTHMDCHTHRWITVMAGLWSQGVRS